MFRTALISMFVTSAALTITTALFADRTNDPLCALTRPDIEGPYWIPGSPERSNLRDPGDGPLLDLILSVVDQDCEPIPNAWIDIWHADSDGDYDKKGWGYRGHHFADVTGHSILETVIPGLYPGRTRHIHVKVRGVTPSIFTTQLYFPDVPENDDDFFYHPDLEVSVIEEDADGNMIAEFQFVVEDRHGCPDINGDNYVNVSDLLAIIDQWGLAKSPADVNFDGIVDVTDLLEVVGNWGPCE
jgi:protocatechuate 3,4-dioxygenase beta subunit